MRTLIVDDEPLARSRLKRLLAAHSTIELIGEADNAADALELVELYQPDLIMLDIEMPGGDGLSLAEALNQRPIPPAIILVTAHPEHALDAYRIGPSDYLLKPVDPNRLSRALDNVGSHTRAHLEKNEERNPWVSYHVGNSLRRIRFDQVQYFMAEDKIVKMVFDGGEAIMNESLNGLANTYQSMVIRANRNLLININKLKSLHNIDGAYYIALIDCQARLSVSRRKVSELKTVITRIHSSPYYNQLST